MDMAHASWAWACMDDVGMDMHGRGCMNVGMNVGMDTWTWTTIAAHFDLCGEAEIELV